MTDNESVAAHAKSLDELWERANELFVNSRPTRPELMEIVVVMTSHLDELLKCKLYITDRERATQYAELEDVMVKAIARLMKLSYSTGEEYKTRFYAHHRSLRAQYLLRWHGAYARLAAYFDPSRM